LRLWHGEYENVEATWLRWCDERGNLLATGEEQRWRAERLAARLRELGIDPDQE
jgi:hypothetical protein